eukprot:CAMPEP_0195252692 /NCGR_PEP_ID=MMETSP0706-20130129/4013_1 /TAXON_ID=33640 /ORGANISM="Asterionellopsis glacialis, Strain CCMP134" /LENGTH=68 /DNA_ID=CAMNT_0040305035 /DNA_START=189 /DNA_END=395 /DNA_ORIENTATION=-
MRVNGGLPSCTDENDLSFLLTIALDDKIVAPASRKSNVTSAFRGLPLEASNFPQRNTKTFSRTLTDEH